MNAIPKVVKREADVKRRMAQEMRASIRHDREAPLINEYADWLEAEAAAMESRRETIAKSGSPARRPAHLSPGWGN